MKTLVFLLLVLPPSWIQCASVYGSADGGSNGGATDTYGDTSGANGNPNNDTSGVTDTDDDTSGSTDTDDDTSGSTDTDDDTSGATDTDDDTSGATDTDDDTSGATDTDDDTSGSTDTDDVDDDDLPQCYSESTSSRYTLGCADGNEAQRWNGCIDIQSYRDRCPKYHFPCNDLRDNGIEFKCGTDCSTKGGKRSDCINKTKCYSESSSSSDTLGCASGNEAPRWNGCILEGSYRVRCPYGYYPCNDLRDNGKEFKCGTDCSTLGGKRIDCIDEDRPTCYSEPTSSDDQLECADGTFASLWDGCINKDSYRVRCPKGYLPCIDIRENGKEFMCGTDCSTKGGKRRDCIND